MAPCERKKEKKKDRYIFFFKVSFHMLVSFWQLHSLPLKLIFQR